MTFSCTWSAFSQTWVVQSHFLHSQCWLTWVSWCNLCRYKYKWDINSLRTEFLNNSLRTELKIKHRRNHKTNKSKIYSVILTAVFWLLTKCIWYQLEKKVFEELPWLYHCVPCHDSGFPIFPHLNHRKTFAFMVCCKIFGHHLLWTRHLYTVFAAALINLQQLKVCLHQHCYVCEFRCWQLHCLLILFIFSGWPHPESAYINLFLII